MPIYVYRTLPTDGSEPQRFEVMQRMSDARLTEHPETGEPVERVVTPPAVVLKHSSRREANILSDANLSKNGFSKYERTGDGAYERTAGKSGPRKIQS